MCVGRNVQKGALEATIHILVWQIGWHASHFILAGTSSVEAYAMLSAWWFALYAGYVLRVTIQAFVLLLVSYSLFSIIVIVCQTQTPELREHWASSLLILLGQAFLFASPVIINAVVRNGMNKYRQSLSKR